MMEVGRIIEKGYFRHELNIKDISKNKVEKCYIVFGHGKDMEPGTSEPASYFLRIYKDDTETELKHTFYTNRQRYCGTEMGSVTLPVSSSMKNKVKTLFGVAKSTKTAEEECCLAIYSEEDALFFREKCSLCTRSGHKCSLIGLKIKLDQELGIVHHWLITHIEGLEVPTDVKVSMHLTQYSLAISCTHGNDSKCLRRWDLKKCSFSTSSDNTFHLDNFLEVNISSNTSSKRQMEKTGFYKFQTRRSTEICAALNAQKETLKQLSIRRRKQIPKQPGKVTAKNPSTKSSSSRKSVSSGSMEPVYIPAKPKHHPAMHKRWNSEGSLYFNISDVQRHCGNTRNKKAGSFNELYELVRVYKYGKRDDGDNDIRKLRVRKKFTEWLDRFQVKEQRKRHKHRPLTACVSDPGHTRGPYEETNQSQNKHQDDPYSIYMAKDISNSLMKILGGEMPHPDTLDLHPRKRIKLTLQLSYINTAESSFIWQDLAERIGLDNTDTQMVGNFCAYHKLVQAEVVLKHWQWLYNKYGNGGLPGTRVRPCTKGELQKILLEELEVPSIADLLN